MEGPTNKIVYLIMANYSAQTRRIPVLRQLEHCNLTCIRIYIYIYTTKNIPGTHQYAVTLVAQIVAQILGLFFKSILVDKVSWYLRFFLILSHNDYTFVTSPVLSAIPSPALICSIVGSPNRLDLCLKLLFDCQNSLNNGYVEGSFIRLLEPVCT